MIGRYVDSSYLQGVGLSTILSSYMFSWTLGAAIGLSSFVGIGFFILIGAFCIYWTSSQNYFSNLTESIATHWWIYVLIAILVGASIFFGDSKDFAWSLFGVLFILLLPLLDLKEKSRFTLGFAHVAVCGAAFYLALNQDAVTAASAYGDASRVGISEDNGAFSLIAYAGAFGLVASFNNAFLGIGNRIVALLSIIICAMTIVMAGTRSVYAGVLMALLYILFSKTGRSAASAILYTVVAMLIVLLIVMLGADLMGDRLAHIQEQIVNGAYTFLQIGGVPVDDSAMGRVYQRDHALSLFADNIVLGAGYKTFWVDCPVLQIFSDMGLFIGALYVFSVLIYPLYRIALFRNITAPSVRLMFILYIVDIPRLFLHGQPYDWAHFSYVFLPYLIYHQHSYRAVASNPSFRASRRQLMPGKTAST
ncbi:O-antigen ligase family protein [Oryzifoliimicrobium ureilyticus]|uniref:O-antigen ligase family protein n=1 Tax=Oryzifoliimicrobium ureilyticus TaxID=3113724 RepID=UPI00307623C7